MPKEVIARTYNPPPGKAPDFKEATWKLSQGTGDRVWGNKINPGLEYKFFETLNFGWIIIREPDTKKLIRIIKL